MGGEREREREIYKVYSNLANDDSNGVKGTKWETLYTLQTDPSFGFFSSISILRVI